MTNIKTLPFLCYFSQTYLTHQIINIAIINKKNMWVLDLLNETAILWNNKLCKKHLFNIIFQEWYLYVVIENILKYETQCVFHFLVLLYETYYVSLVCLFEARLIKIFGFLL